VTALETVASRSGLRAQHGPALRFYVVFTTPDWTRVALRAASGLARDLGARLSLLLPQIVPYPLPLECPPVQAEFTSQAVEDLIGDTEVETAVSVCLCRDRNEAVRAILPAASVVLMGVSRQLWRNRERSLARLLRADGHHTILIEGSRTS
jgi:hypothetical protein